MDDDDATYVITGESASKSPALEQELRVGTELGGCRIERRLGKGAMATIYLGRQLDLDREVAIKVLSERLTQEENHVLQFLQEARSLAKLEHPNIVSIYSVGRSDETLFLILQLVKGGSLRDMLRERRRLDPDEATRMMRQVAGALLEAHRQGIIHRDIKPGNILLGPGNVPKITDFGLALMSDSAGDAFGQGIVVGTPHYMSPEAIDALEVDQRSDVYSLGCTFYELLTGSPPFAAKETQDVLLFHLTKQVLPPHVREPEVPMSLSSIVCKMLSKKPKDRYASMEELIRDLENPAGVSEVVVQEVEPPPRLLLQKSPEELRPLESLVVAASRTRLILSIAAVILIGGLLALRSGPVQRALGLAELEQDEEVTTILARAELEALEREAPNLAPEEAIRRFQALADKHRGTSVGQDAATAAKRLQLRFEEARGKLRAALDGARTILVRGDLGHALDTLTKVETNLLSTSEVAELTNLVHTIREELRRRKVAWVPGGSFTLGEDESRRTVRVEGFYIDLQEVTCGNYAKFLDQTGVKPPPGWASRRAPRGREDFPVTGISFTAARRYAKFHDKRLPTSIEWEKAARGPKGLRWPWGEEFEAGHCNWGGAKRPGVRAARSFPKDRSFYGCFDMAGNVSEMTLGPLHRRTMPQVLVQGGGWRTANAENTRPAFFMRWNKPRGHSAVGFRCVTTTLRRGS